MQNQYTWIRDAQVIHETTAAYKFKLNDAEHWIPKSQSKLEGDKLHVLTWVAAQRKQAWSKPIPESTIDDAIALMREALAILRTLKQ